MPYKTTPGMALRGLDSVRDSHLGLMSPRLEVSHPPTPGPDADDERREAKADGDNPFPVDRAVLRDVVREKLGCEPTHVKFLSSGTFHKAFLVSLADGPDVVARIARRYMPKFKTESEIATINYIRVHSNIPVPFIYAYDSDPYNKLGGEYIIMSKAPGVPLIRHFHSMSPSKVQDLLTNLANMLVPLSNQTFPAIGSLYQTGDLTPSRDVVRSILRRSRSTPVPELNAPASPSLLRPHHHHHLHAHHHAHGHQRPGPSPLHESSVLPDSPSMWTTPAPVEPSVQDPKKSDFYVGPIVAWPFFGGGRGELPSRARPGVPLSPSAPVPAPLPSPTRSSSSSNALQFEPSPSPSPELGQDEEDPDELDRGPFRTFESYARACARREVAGVRREQEKAGAAHKPHLVPASEDGRGAKRVRKGLGALGSDGLGGRKGAKKAGRRRRRGGLGSLGNGGGLGSLGSGEGRVPALSVSSSSSSSGIASPSDSDGCSCGTSACSCSESSGSSPGSTSSSSDAEGSDGEGFYRDYRSAQRSSLFVGLNFARLGAVRAEMERWVGWMTAQSQGQTHHRVDGIAEEREDSDSTATDAEEDPRPTPAYGGVGAGGFVALTPTPTPSSVKSKKLATSPPRGVGVGGGGFVGVGPAPVSTAAPTSSFTFAASPPRARGGIGPGGFVGVAPIPTPAPSSTSSTPARGVGVGGGGFMGVAAPLEVPARSGFAGVGVGGGGWMSVGGGGIPSPEDESPVSAGAGGLGGFGGFGGVGVGGGGFLSVAAPQSPPRSVPSAFSIAPKPVVRGVGVGGGGFVSVAHAEVPKEVRGREEARGKRKREEVKDELGDFVFDLHDLSLANIFVDPADSSKITCIIDWESTTIRPLWHAAHLPTFLVSATHAHSHPVTPRLQSSKMSRGGSHPSHPSHASHSESRMSHTSHKTLGSLGAHLPPNGAASGMASIAALTAALNQYAQGVYEGQGSRWDRFGESPRIGVGESPRHSSPRYNTFDSPRVNTFDSPRTHYFDQDPTYDPETESAPRTAVLSIRHPNHSYSYPSPLGHARPSGPNTAVNAIAGVRPGGVSRSMSHRGDVHAHFDEHEHRHSHRDGGETPRRITREEAADLFKRIAAEVRCPGEVACSHTKHKETCGERWARAERERASWRVAHRAVEWDGWELGLVEGVLEDAMTLQGDLDF